MSKTTLPAAQGRRLRRPARRVQLRPDATDAADRRQRARQVDAARGAVRGALRARRRPPQPSRPDAARALAAVGRRLVPGRARARARRRALHHQARLRARHASRCGTARAARSPPTSARARTSSRSGSSCWGSTRTSSRSAPSCSQGELAAVVPGEERLRRGSTLTGAARERGRHAGRRHQRARGALGARGRAAALQLPRRRVHRHRRPRDPAARAQARHPRHRAQDAGARPHRHRQAARAAGQALRGGAGRARACSTRWRPTAAPRSRPTCAAASRSTRTTRRRSTSCAARPSAWRRPDTSPRTPRPSCGGGRATTRRRARPSTRSKRAAARTSTRERKKLDEELGELRSLRAAERRGRRPLRRAGGRAAPGGRRGQQAARRGLQPARDAGDPRPRPRALPLPERPLRHASARRSSGCCASSPRSRSATRPRSRPSSSSAPRAARRCARSTRCAPSGGCRAARCWRSASPA